MKVVLLTNILTPYRKNFYDSLYHEFLDRGIDFQVLLMARTEPNRNWNYEDFETSYTTLLPYKTFSYNDRFIHFNTKYAKILKKLKPDIVIAAGGYVFPAVWTSIRLKRKLGFKLLFWSESHLQEMRTYSRFWLNVREGVRKKIYTKFNGFWYAGKLSKEFIEYYADPNAIYFFVPNLISENSFFEANRLRANKVELRDKWGVKQDKFVFICPARLTNVKGILPFLKILKKSSLNSNVTILIPGDGELKDSIHEYSSNNNLDIRLLGYKSESELIELYALADSFLMPSLSDPNPLTCIEAIWAGLPLLVSNHVGNHPEIVNVGENGYVFNYDDSQKVIWFIEKIVNSRKKWRDNARITSLSIANEKYKTKDAVENLVNEMISSKVSR